MKLTDIINEEGFQDKKDRLIKKAEAYYRIFRTGTFEHSIKHSLGHHDRMETHTFQYKLSEFHKVIVPMGSNIPTLVCDVHVTDITGGDMGGNYDPISIYVVKGILRRIFEKKIIGCSIKDVTGDVAEQMGPNGLFINEDSMVLDMDKLKKKVEACYKFLKKGIFNVEFLHSEGTIHEYIYTLSNIDEINYDGEPIIKCDVHVDSLNADKKSIRPYYVSEKINNIFKKYNILIEINNFSGDILKPKTKKKMNEDVYQEYLDTVKKKAVKSYQHFRKGKVKWHDNIYDYEFSEDFKFGGFGLIEGMKKYCIIHPDEFTIKGHGMYKKEHPDYPNGYNVYQEHLPFEEIQKLFGILFNKYKVAIRIVNHTAINRVYRDQLNEEDNGVDVNKEDKAKKKGETYYKFLKKGKIVWHGLTYNYELSDEYDYSTTKMGMLGSEDVVPILKPKGIKVTGHGSEDDELKTIPSSAVQGYFHNRIFKKYGVVISFNNAEFIGGVMSTDKWDNKQGKKLNEEVTPEEEKQRQIKKCETVYKFLKKGKFKQTYVNIPEQDNYSYELSDEYYIIPNVGSDPKIECMVHIKCLSKDKKIRPHIVVLHLKNIFNKYHILLHIDDFTGDINWESPVKSMSHDN